MSRILGSLFCLIRRNHAWRRLRKGEWRGVGFADISPLACRICGTCGKVKEVKRRVKEVAK